MDAGLERLELGISKFLRAGVMVAGALLLTGWSLTVARGGGSIAPLTTYASEPLAHALGAAIARGEWPLLISYLGLAILIALPFTRVALTAVLFVRRREWVLAGAAAFVATALVLSVLLGIDL